MKPWVDVLDPSIKRWRFRAHFCGDGSVVDTVEAGATADMIKTLAQQLDDYKQTVDRLHRNFKWTAMYFFMTGYSFARLLDYLLTL